MIKFFIYRFSLESSSFRFTLFFSCRGANSISHQLEVISDFIKHLSGRRGALVNLWRFDTAAKTVEWTNELIIRFPEWFFFRIIGRVTVVIKRLVNNFSLFFKLNLSKSNQLHFWRRK